MSLVLRANSLALGYGAKTSFCGSGGEEPYTYSVSPGGVGGSINSSTGIYTAPRNITGIDTVVVTDDDGATASLDVSVLNSLELVCDIIRTEMNLDDDRVWIWDQKIPEPKDSNIYVVLSVLACKPFSNITKFDGATGTDIQSTNFQATVSIDIKSRSTEALNRKEELLMSLASTYAEQQQELNGFFVSTLPTSFVNLSDQDGAAIPYHFNISIAIQYAVTKTKTVPYFDNFQDVEVTTED